MPRPDAADTLGAERIQIVSIYLGAGVHENGVFKPLEDVKLDEGTLAEVHVLSIADRLRGKPRSVKDFAFFGMWKDRTDIADSVEYVNKLRSDLRG
jgi:hypothetical protein